MKFSGPTFSGRFTTGERARISVRIRAYEVDGKDPCELFKCERGQGIIVELSGPCREVLLRGNNVIAVNLQDGFLSFDPPVHCVIEGDIREQREVKRKSEPVLVLQNGRILEYEQAALNVPANSLLDRVTAKRIKPHNEQGLSADSSILAPAPGDSGAADAAAFSGAIAE